MSGFHVSLVTAAIGAAAYIFFAVGLLKADREPKPEGSHTAEGTLSVLATLPAAIAFDFFEWKFDCRNNVQMAAAIALCATLTAAIIFGVMSFVGFLWHLSAVPA